MSPNTIALVQSTWQQVVPIRATAAELFYGRLFDLDPGVKPLFKGDMKAQGEKLMTMIDVAVRGLTDLDRLVPAVQTMGRRHVGYGVRDEHYATVGQALLWTLKQGLGPSWTDEVAAAWTAVYGVLASTMQSAVEGKA